MANDKGVWDDLSESYKASLKGAAPPAPQETSPQSASSGTSVTWWIMAAILVWTAYSAVKRGTSTPPQAISVEEALAQDARDFSRQLPVTVGGEIRYDSVRADPGRILVYHVTFVNHPASEISPQAVPFLAPQVKSTACANEKLRALFRQNVTLRYLYYANDGHPVGEVRVLPSDCLAQ